MFLARYGNQSLAELEEMELSAIAFWANELNNLLKKEKEAQEKAQEQAKKNASR